MKRALVVAFLIVSAAIQGALPNDSAGLTVRHVGFDDMVRTSSLIVQGRVLKLEGFRSGGPGGAVGAPAGEPSTSPAVRPDAASGQSVPTLPTPPVEVGGRPGGMIFTRVTMETTTAPIKGTAGKTVEFVVAGGSADGRIAVVPGMPTFEVGAQYVLFLRDGYRNAADPVVGVNQGYFRVVEDPTSGLQVLQAADSDYVLAIEADRIVTRHNPQRPGAAPQLASPPAAQGPLARGQTSAEVERYWHSTEPLMTVGEFVNAVRARTRP